MEKEGDDYIFLGESCLGIETLDSVSLIYNSVSLEGCKHLCAERHSDACSLLIYGWGHQSCYLTQPVKVETATADQPCTEVEVYRKQRHTGEYIFCIIDLLSRIDSQSSSVNFRCGFGFRVKPGRAEYV